jgi:hypothetical protein
MTKEQAKTKGFTLLVSLSSTHYELDLLVRPQDDLDTSFTAYCLDEQGLITVNGWHFTQNELEAA